MLCELVLLFWNDAVKNVSRQRNPSSILCVFGQRGATKMPKKNFYNFGACQFQKYVFGVTP